LSRDIRRIRQTMKLGRIPLASSAAVSKSMKGNRGRNTRLELRLRGALARRGIGGFRCGFVVEGTRVDFAFPFLRVAVMAHGCFWHNCPTCRLALPKTHRGYWRRKFAINRLRDMRIRRRFAKAGWRFGEVWGHEVDNDLQSAVAKIHRLLTPGGLSEQE
jgi:DNA mismatch endonuclease (patch repair protein)